jgi:DedD protein
MADITPSADELALRRRARRRLVGAVALALLAVVVLPMVFDPEPRPLGDKVEIKIPDQKTPFEATPMPAPEVTVAEPVQVVPEAVPPVEAVKPPVARPAPVVKPEAKPEAKASGKAEVKPAPIVKPAAKPDPKPAPVAKPEAKPAAVAKPEPKPDSKPAAPAVKPDAKPEAKASVATKPEPKPEAKPAATAKPAGDYFLQLGVFASQANADQMVAKAKAAGFKASAVAAEGKYRVRVGPIPERAKALDYQAKLKAKNIANVLVEP